MEELIKANLDKATTYEAYREMTRSLLAEGKTTGPNQSEIMIHYTKLNEQRMSRLDKTVKLTDEAKEFYSSIKGEYFWLVISEPWCGDASQIVPLFSALAETSSAIDMKIVLRDENPELMDNFEQNGSRAIPVVIMIEKETLNVLGSWGARPAEAQEIVNEYKKMDPKPPYDELATNLQKWYNKDKTKTTQKELVDFAKKCLEKIPA